MSEPTFEQMAASIRERMDDRSLELLKLTDIGDEEFVCRYAVFSAVHELAKITEQPPSQIVLGMLAGFVAMELTEL